MDGVPSGDFSVNAAPEHGAGPPGPVLRLDLLPRFPYFGNCLLAPARGSCNATHVSTFLSTSFATNTTNR